MKTNLKKHLTSLLLSLLPLQGHANWCDEKPEGGWYGEHTQGFYYFEEESVSLKPSQEPTSLSPPEAEQALEQKAQALKQLLALAVYDPTPEHVEQYMSAQKEIIEKASLFSEVWALVLLKNPELSSLSEQQTSTFGLRAQHQLQETRQQHLLDSLSQDHFLLLFVKAEEPYLDVAVEIGKAFSEKNNWHFKTVVIGEGATFESGYEQDRGLSEKLKIEVTPSWFIAQPESFATLPIGVGLISVSELEDNITKQVRSISNDQQG